MPAAQLSSLRAPRLDAACRIHGGELAIQYGDVRGRQLFNRPHGAKGANRRAEQGNAGEEEESLLFSGGWHDGRLILPHSFERIEIFPAE